MDSILITGGTGFIGSHLTEYLLKNGKTVILLKRSFSNTWRIDEIKEEYKNNLILIDIDKEPLQNIFENYNIEGIFHLATYYKKQHQYEDVEKMIETNIKFPTKILENAVNSNIKYFINTGTFFEYSLNQIPLTELTSIDLLNLYSTTKIAFENILKFYNKEYKINSSTLKLFTPYVSRDNEHKIIPYLIINSLKNNEINIKNPKNRLDIVHVSDIIDAFYKVRQNIHNFNDYEVFNIAKDINYSIEDIYSSIKFNLNIENKKDYNENSIPLFSNPKKTKKMINWEPKIEIDTGMKLTINYYKEKYNL